MTDAPVLRIFTEPQQGASYDTLLAVAQASEQLDFDAFFRSDHYLKMGSASGLPGPTDAWVTLAGLARETSRIRLGTLVTAATFRQPGPLAVTVAQVDEMSGGRVELGLGAGWYEQEHTAGSIPFLSLAERFDRFEDQLAILTGMWATPAGTTFDYEGRHHRIVGSPGLPKPVQSPLPIIIGGRGTRKTPRLAATYAAEFNLAFASLDQFVSACAGLRTACDAIGRDQASMRFSIALVVCCGANEATVVRRAASIGREPAELRASGAAGSPSEVAETLRRFHAAGAERIYLQVLDLHDLEHLQLIAEQVRPQLT